MEHLSYLIPNHMCAKNELKAKIKELNAKVSD